MTLSALWYAVSSLLSGLWLGSAGDEAGCWQAAELLVKEQEQERDLHVFGGEPVSVAGTIAFEQTVAFEFAQIVAELVQPVGIGRKLKRRQDA